MNSYKEAREVTDLTLSEWIVPVKQITAQELLMIKAWVLTFVEDKQFTEEEIDELTDRFVAIYNLGVAKNQKQNNLFE